MAFLFVCAGAGSVEINSGFLYTLRMREDAKYGKGFVTAATNGHKGNEIRSKEWGLYERNNAHVCHPG